jgi:SAM-dependent methyltransferase
MFPSQPLASRRRLLGAGAAAAALAGARPVLAQSALMYEELDTPFVTTPQNVVDTMLELARVGPGDTLLDLGSGDGRIVITAAQRFGIRGTGIEIDPRLVARARDNAKKAGVADRATFLEQDLFATDLTQASVITIYLLPAVNLKLRPALMRLNPGTRIVSHDWAMGDWKPDRTLTVAAPGKTVGLNKSSDLFLWELK